MIARLLARVPFWLLVVAACLFIALQADGWVGRLIMGCLTTFAISGLVSAHLGEWKADDFRMF